MWQKRCNTSCSSHSISTHQCSGSFLSHSHCLLFYLALCDGHFKPSPRPPPDPFQAFLGELSPCSCGHQQSPWGLSYQRQTSLHITQLTRQQPEPKSSQGSRQPGDNHQPHTRWIIQLWLAWAGSHSTTMLSLSNDSGFKKVSSDHRSMTNSTYYSKMLSCLFHCHYILNFHNHSAKEKTVIQFDPFDSCPTCYS